MKKPILLSLSVLCISFGLMAQNNCTLPVITEIKGGGTYCPGMEATLEVVGSLNNASTWTWYSDSCGGQSIGTGSSIKIKITKTTSFFVRGTGNCVGATATCSSVEVKKDDIGPELILSPKDTTVTNTNGQCGAIVSFILPKGKDRCSDTVFVKQVAGLAPGSFFPVGITEVKYELSDTIGNVTPFSFKVTVKDNELPEITCVENIEVNNDPGKCGAMVTYDVPVGTDNCPGATTTRTEGLGSGAFFPVGITTETYTVTDASGNSKSCSFTITVNDIEPPIITLRDKHTELWPPNHKHHQIQIEEYIKSVTDNCGGVTIEDVIIDEVGSDEPNNGKGDGNTLDDILIDVDCRYTQLLAERSGTGNGRVYVVKLAVMDLHGNIGTAEFTVGVPHDMGMKNKAVKDSIIYVKNGCDLIQENETHSTSSKTSASGRLEQQVSVYPNPFNGSFSLDYLAKADDYVHIELYNLMGVRIAKLHEQTVQANNHYEWTFETPSLSANQYVLLIKGFKTQHIVRLIQKN